MISLISTDIHPCFPTLLDICRATGRVTELVKLCCNVLMTHAVAQGSFLIIRKKPQAFTFISEVLLEPTNKSVLFYMSIILHEAS